MRLGSIASIQGDKQLQQVLKDTQDIYLTFNTCYIIYCTKPIKLF